MKFIAKLAILMTLIGILSMIPVSAKVADTFTGTGDKTTTTFTVAKYSKIDWSYTKENDFDFFNAYIYQQGNDIFKASIGGAESGTSYYYSSGTYYFDVSSANIASWSITTTETNGEYLNDQDTISGSYSKSSKLFNAYGDTEITWSYTKENDFDLFNVYIYEIGKSIFVDNFSGESGTTQFYKTGEFYMKITSANIFSYTITINVKGGSSSATTSINQNGNSDSLSSTNPIKTTTSKTANFEVLALISILPYTIKNLKDRRKE
jgi:hypothetical protein